MLRLVHAGFVEEQRIQLAETQAHGDMSPAFVRHCILTERGARQSGSTRSGLVWPRSIGAARLRDTRRAVAVLASPAVPP
jgi:hypothetical protein